MEPMVPCRKEGWNATGRVTGGLQGPGDALVLRLGDGYLGVWVLFLFFTLKV